MTQLMTNLFKQISDLSCTARAGVLEEAVRDWRACTEVPAIRQALLQWLQESASSEQMRTSARETSTHYVWPVYTTANGYGLVINEFKSPEHMAAGYATTLHDHRYSFVSLMLSGSYSQFRYHVEMNGAGQATSVRETGRDDVTTGSIIGVSSDAFHRLANIKDHTTTLVIRCPALKEASISVDIGTLRTSRHFPVEARITQLMDALAIVQDRGLGEEE